MFLGAVPDTCNVEEAWRYIAFEEALEGTEGHQLRPILYGADTDKTYSWKISVGQLQLWNACITYPSM